MRSLLLLICALVYANAVKQELIDEMLTTIQEVGIDCIESEKATTEDMEALAKKLPPVTHEGKCAVFCVTKKLNILNPDGSFGTGYTQWLNKLKADDPDYYIKLMNVYLVCETKLPPQDDKCELAWQLFACTLEEGRKAGLTALF